MSYNNNVHHEKNNASKYQIPSPVLIDESMKENKKAFDRTDNWNTTYEVLKGYIMGVVLLQQQIRFMNMLLVLFMYWMYLRILIFLKLIKVIDEEAREKAAQAVVFGGSKVILSCFCMYNVERHDLTVEQMNRIISKFDGRGKDEQEEGEKSSGDNNLVETFKSKKPYLILSNHLTFCDPAITMNEVGECSFVGKIDLAHYPAVGLLMKQLKCLFVSKSGGLVAQIIDRVKHYYSDRSANTRLLVFPEGTTTFGNHIIRFHDGAFVPGVPVEPMVMRAEYKSFNPAWSNIPEIQYMRQLFSQFYTHLHIIHFPPYYPSKEERENPSLYAMNVRRLMVEANNLVLGHICGKMDYSNEKFVRYLKKE